MHKSTGLYYSGQVLRGVTKVVLFNTWYCTSMACRCRTSVWLCTSICAYGQIFCINTSSECDDSVSAEGPQSSVGSSLTPPASTRIKLRSLAAPIWPSHADVGVQNTALCPKSPSLRSVLAICMVRRPRSRIATARVGRGEFFAPPRHFCFVFGLPKHERSIHSPFEAPNMSTLCAQL